MGTDIYLNWDKMSKKDKKKQVTGFDINCGNSGYLRASIGMVNENSVLRAIFPNELWEPEDEEDDGGRYEFTEDRYKRLQLLGLAYLFAELKGEEIHDPRMKVTEDMGNKITKALKGLGFEQSQIGIHNHSFRYAVMWLNSLFSFFELGMDKEEKGLKPKIYISW